MNSLYSQIANLILCGKNKSCKWQVMNNTDKEVIEIYLNDDIQYRIYKDINSNSTFFLLGDGINASPLNEYYIMNLLKSII